MTLALRLLGMTLCVLPPAITTLEHFPLWLGKETTALSAIAVLLLLLAAIPLIRVIRAKLHSPSAWMIWLCLWLALRVIAPIADTVTRIALVSFPTSLLGALCFRLAERRKNVP